MSTRLGMHVDVRINLMQKRGNVMITSLSHLISLHLILLCVSILSNHGAHLIPLLIYGCGISQ